MSRLHPQFESVLASIRRALALPDLQPDADGICQLVFDERFVVNIGWNDPHVVWFAPVGFVAPEHRGEMLAALMQGNLFWRETGGATLSLSQDASTVVLAYQAPAHTLTQEDVLALLQWFMQRVDEWIDRSDAISRDMVAAPVPAQLIPAFSGVLPGMRA